MNRFAYYEDLKKLARELRQQYGFATPRVTRSDLRRIYGKEGIRIDLWPHSFKKLRGTYFKDELGSTVMLVKGLPEDPTVFTMAHELKHHFVDQEQLVTCLELGRSSAPIEIGAEVLLQNSFFPNRTLLLP